MPNVAIVPVNAESRVANAQLSAGGSGHITDILAVSSYF
jgi:hypothetical protein